MRDLEKDLALCEAATKGPWTVVPTKDNWGETRLPRIDAPNTIVLYFGAKMDYGDISGEEPEEADLAFIAASREGWPEAIRRAMVAEAEVERLRPIYEAYRELSRLKDESRNECPECLEERCRNLHPGAGCSKHLQAITIAECNLHNAVNDVGRYEESHGIGGDPT